MSHCQPGINSSACLGLGRICVAGLAILFVLACRTPSLQAGPFPANPVEDLKKALNSDRKRAHDDAGARARRRANIHQRIDSFIYLGDIADGLMLQEWQLEIAGSAVPGDQQEWDSLAEMFSKGIAVHLEKKDAAAQEAAAKLLRDIGSAKESAIKGLLGKKVLTPLTPKLAELVRDKGNDPAVRISAAQALGKLNPTLTTGEQADATVKIEPAVVEKEAGLRIEARKRLDQSVDALSALLDPAGTIDARRTAARAIADLTRSISQQERQLIVELQTLNDIETYYAYFKLTQAAIGAFADPDADVRTGAIDAVVLLAKTEDDLLQGESPLERVFPEAKELTDDMLKKLGKQRDQLREDISKQFVEFNRALGKASATRAGEGGTGLGDLALDRNPAVRLRALEALRELGTLYQRLKPHERPQEIESNTELEYQGRRLRASPVYAFAPADPDKTAPHEALYEGLRSSLPSLAAALADKSAKNRLIAVEALEVLGSDIVKGAPNIADALIRSLGDSDRFVRWAAARTISKLGNPSPATAVPALAKMLLDSDLDLQMIAANTLYSYGPDARDAVPNLTKAIERGDSDLRLAAMRTLEAIGTDAYPAIPAVTRALGDEKATTRKRAADLLGRFGPKAKDSIAALRKATEDEEPDVRRAASQAILNITTPRER